MRLTRSRALAGVAVASALALGAAGCGDGGTATVVTTVAPATSAAVTVETPDTTVATTLAPPTDATTAVTVETGDTVDTNALGELSRYLDDVQAASGALTTFGAALQNVNNPRQLEAQYDDLTAELDTFDEAIARMDGYELSEEVVDAQRMRLVAQGPDLSDVLRRFLDAAQESIDTNNPNPIRAILPEVQTEITEFVQAAQGTGTTP